MKRLLLLVLTVALAGCAGKHTTGPAFRAGDEQMPEFLNGPAALLLTNFYGYSAHVDTDILRPYSQGKFVTGSLLQRQGRFVFQPDQPKTKKETVAGMIFIWDANLRHGWTCSEALQGYAPVDSSLQITNVQINENAAILEFVNGVPCHRVEARLARADGSIAAYKVWQADDLRRFPIRIQSDSGGRAVTLTFSDIRFDSPPQQLFNPPDGFVKFDSPVALMNELIIRDTTVEQRGQPTEINASAVPARGAAIAQPEPGR